MDELNIAEMYRSLPGARQWLPDEVSDLHALHLDLRDARERLKRMEREWILRRHAMMTMLRKQWSEEELTNAGFQIR